MASEMTLSASHVAPLPAIGSGRLGGFMRGRRVQHSFRLVPLWISWLILLLTFLNGSSAQLDPVKNFCRRFGHQTALIDRKLYIDGGFINYNPLSQYPTNYSNFGLLYHDLDTPGPGQMPQLYANLTKNSTIPSVNGGTLWADNLNKRFYLFGGEYYQQPPPQQYTLWSFDTIYNQWVSFGSPEQDDIGAVSYGAGVSVSELGVGYYYGGWKSNNTMPGWAGPPLAQSSLVQYIMDSNSWSTDPGPDSVGRAEGAMVFIPIGDGGMLVYFGGVQDPYNNGTWIGQPTETIFLYDVLSSKWYTQNATGTTPPMRRRFCAGATWAVDQSSYNIYLYGGAGMPPNTSGFDDVYVLTIPSFQWIKMYPTDGNLTGAFPHHSLSCNVVDNAQMLIIGGTFPTLDICDVPDQYGVHNMDMGQQNDDKALWKLYVTNLTKYAVPDPIISVIGGSGGGGATKTAPDAGFESPDMRVLMTRKAHIPRRTPTRPPTPTGAPGQNKPLSTGAIAGIAIAGAIALIFLILATIILIRRRRRRQSLPHSYSQPPKPPIITGPHDWSPNGGAASSTTYSPNSPHPHSPFLQYHPSLNQHGNGLYIPPPSQHEPVELPVGSPPHQPPPPPFTAAPGAVATWLGPDGIIYELVPGGGATHPTTMSGTAVLNKHQSSSSATAGGGSAGGYDSGTGTNNSTASGQPQTKVDSEGRVWVQVPVSGDGSSPPMVPLPLQPRPSIKVAGGGGGNGGGGGGSPGGLGLGTGLGLARYHSAGGGSAGGGGGGESVSVSPGSKSGVEQHHQKSGTAGRVGEPQELDCESRGNSGEGPLGERAGWDAAHGRPRHLTFYHP